ncbi:MAG: PEGA domain-containing protein [Bacteroidota bacterium]
MQMTKIELYLASTFFLFGCQSNDTISNIDISDNKDSYGKIVCISTPLGARIFIDTVDTGLFTPATIESVKVGDHQIRFAKKYFHDYIGTVQVKKDLYSGSNGFLRHNVNLSNHFPLYVGSYWNYISYDTVSKLFDTLHYKIIDIIDRNGMNPVTVWVEEYKMNTYSLIDTLLIDVKSDTLTFWHADLQFVRRLLPIPLYEGQKWWGGFGFQKTVEGIDTLSIKTGEKLACYRIAYITGDHEHTREWISPQYGYIKMSHSSYYGRQHIQEWVLDNFIIRYD